MKRKKLQAIQDFRKKLASAPWREYYTEYKPVLSASSKAQTAAFQCIQEDILLRDVSNDDDKDDTANSTVDPTCVVSALLDSSEGTVNNNWDAVLERSDTEQQSDLLDSLTQVFLSSEKKSPPVSTKIADLIDSVLSGKLSTDTAKEYGEKYFLAENCGRLCPVTVNEEIWDLLPRRARSVDLAFQCARNSDSRAFLTCHVG